MAACGSDMGMPRVDVRFPLSCCRRGVHRRGEGMRSLGKTGGGATAGGVCAQSERVCEGARARGLQSTGEWIGKRRRS
eukprot:5266918-Pleurochrysis_carterae.AAC.1